MDLPIRRAAPAEARAVADLWLGAREAAASAGTIPPPAHSPEEVRSWFVSHVLADMEVWVAEGGAGRIAGLLVLDGEWLEQLYVDPGHTGRGIGSALLRFAQRRRPEGLRLWSFVSNTGAQRFYERHGFAEAERTDGRDNEERSPDVLYEWPGRAPA